VTRSLARALETRRAKYSAPLPQEQTRALGVLVKAFEAEWKTVTKQTARDSDIRTLLPFIVVIPFDMTVNKRARLTPPSLGRSIAWLPDRRRDPTPINTSGLANLMRMSKRNMR
jgi:hypothetical protein